MMVHGGDTPARRIAYGYRRATSRTADEGSLKTLVAGFQARLAAFNSRPDDARELLAQGMSRMDPALPAAELAAYTTTASVLLNLDRVVTRD